MFFGLFWGDWTILIVLPAMIFAMWAQMNVTSTFEKYSKEITHSGKTGADAARALLDANGLYDVGIAEVSGKLSDHYDPRNKTLFLSNEVYNSRSAAAIGVACHEAGHAIQHATGYAPLQLRMSMVPVCNFGSMLSMPLFIIGLFLAIPALMLAGIAFFSLATLFQLVTLPVEFDASRRALEGMQNHHLLYDDEVNMAGKVLRAAAPRHRPTIKSVILSDHRSHCKISSIP